MQDQIAQFICLLLRIEVTFPSSYQSMIFLLMLSTSHAEDELDLYRLAKGSQSLDSTKIEM